jgi:tryptophan-rich sensory protein
MPELGDRFSLRDRRLRRAAAWIGAAGIYGVAQGLSAWAAQRAQGRGTRPQYEQFERPAFAPPGAVFPLVWSALNLTTATSAWRIWRAREPGPQAPSRREVLAR